MQTTTKTSEASSDRPLVGATPPFHLLARAAPRYRWWKPLIVGLVASGAYVVLMLALFSVMAIVGLASPEAWSATERFINDPMPDMNEPAAYGLMMMSVVLMLPAIMMATWLFGTKPVGFVSSVAGRIRRRWLLRCLMIAGVFYGVALLGVTVSMAVRGQSLAPDFESSHALALVGLALLLVPFQAAAEEYVFRGYLMQTLGAWCRHPSIAIAVPVPLFVLGHGYELRGMIDVAAFALVAGWLTWRTGGLEAAIALHVVNNVVWSVAGAFGFVDLNATDSSSTDLVVSLLLTLGFAIAAVKAADRTGIQRVRSLES